jgi:glycosyltransferase involved in cell wall biosynthesis
VPAVSVVIPSYNHAAYLAEAVRSVLDQTLRDLELIVVDDGSTDDSLAVLAGIGDPRLRVVSQPNAGAPAALNRGVEQARGALVAVLNSDDAFAPDRLQRCVAALSPAHSLVGSWVQIVDQSGGDLGIKHGVRDCPPWPLAHPERSVRAGDDLRAALLAEHYLATTSNFLFRRADWQRIGGFRRLRYTHDWDFALRLAALAPPHLLEAPLLRYRVHERNTIREDRVAMVFEICWCLAVHLPAAAGRGWLGAATPNRLEVMLHSLYTFGCERVLTMLMAYDVARDEALAEDLLEPADPRRAVLLAFIAERLADGGGAGAPAAAGSLARLRRWLRGGEP